MIFNQFSMKLFLMLTILGLAVILVIFMLHVIPEFNAEWLRCENLHVDTTNSTLELVHIVFRHGPRTPVDTYPNDPYINDSFAPTGWGHVTNNGKIQLYDLGFQLNVRYKEFLEPYYKPDFVHAQATASPRAMMSLATVLASLFPAEHTPMEWDPAFNWQPIPIFSEPLKQDSLLLVRTSCPRYFEALEEVLERPEIKAEVAQYQSLFRNLTALTGNKIASAEDINSLYITLLAEQEFGLKLPDWTKDYFPHKMQTLAEKSYIYNAYTKEMQKIKGGPFLKKMFSEMQEKALNKLQPNDRKLFIYTGHDWTVGNILMALNVWTQQMPRFSIMAAFELHKNKVTGEYYVEIFLRNNEKGCFEQLQVPECDLKCPLKRLIELSNAVLPNEPYELRCTPKNINFVEPPPRKIDQTQNQ